MGVKDVDKAVEADARLLARAKLLALEDDETLETTADRRLAEAARAPHSKTPFFLHNAAESVKEARKAERMESTQRAPVFVVVAPAPKSVADWERNAHALQSQHEQQKLQAMLHAVDAEAVDVPEGNKNQ